MYIVIFITYIVIIYIVRIDPENADHCPACTNSCMVNLTEKSNILSMFNISFSADFCYFVTLCLYLFLP
jgi:hypothetical protein